MSSSNDESDDKISNYSTCNDHDDKTEMNAGKNNDKVTYDDDFTTNDDDLTTNDDDLTTNDDDLTTYDADITNNDGNLTNKHNNSSANKNVGNETNVTYSFIDSQDVNEQKATENINATCTVLELSSTNLNATCSIEENSSINSFPKIEDFNPDSASNDDQIINNKMITYNDKPVEVTNVDSTDSESFTVIEAEDISASSSNSKSEKTIPMRQRTKLLNLDTNNSLDENLVKLICQTVETALKTCLSKYSFKKNKRKSRNRRGKRKINYNDKKRITMNNNITADHHNISNFSHTDIFGNKNNGMDTENDESQNQNNNIATKFNATENIPKRLSPKLISDIIDNALNDNGPNNDNWGSFLNDKAVLSGNVNGSTLWKSSNCLDTNNFTQKRNGDNQSVKLPSTSQSPLTNSHPPWWFRDNILLATEFLNKGTSSAKFNHCYSEEANVKTGLYATMRSQSLTYMNQYENKSFEELRYEDYILQELGAHIREKYNPNVIRSDPVKDLGESFRETVRYAPTFAHEEFLKKNGEIERAQVKYHCMSCMKECSNKSFEELRLYYYTKKNINQVIVKARAHDSNTNRSLDQALGDTALKNFHLLDKNHLNGEATTSKAHSENDISVFNSSIFNDSESIAKTIFSKSNNPFFNPFTHCRLPQFNLDNLNSETPKEITEKSIFDVSPAKVNFVFNPNTTSPVKKSTNITVKPKSDSKIISKLDNSKLLFGWSCKPFTFGKPAEPSFHFNDTAKTSNIFGAIPKNTLKNKSKGLNSDIFRKTIDKLINDNSNDADKVKDSNEKDLKIKKDSKYNFFPFTSAMSSKVLDNEVNNIFIETSNLLHNIDVLTTNDKSEKTQITDIETITHKKVDSKEKSRDFNNKTSSEKYKKKIDRRGSADRPVYEKTNNSCSPKKCFKSSASSSTNDTQSIFLSASETTPSIFNSTFKTNENTNSKKESRFTFFRSEPASASSSKHSSSPFNFSFTKPDEDIANTTTISENSSTLIFAKTNKEDNETTINPFYLKASGSKEIKNSIFETNNVATDDKNPGTIVDLNKKLDFRFKVTPSLGESSKVSMTTPNIFKSALDETKPEINFETVKIKSERDIQFGSNPSSIWSNNSINNGLKSKASSSDGALNQQRKLEFQFDKRIVAEQSVENFVFSFNRNTDTAKVENLQPKTENLQELPNKRQSIFGSPSISAPINFKLKQTSVEKLFATDQNQTRQEKVDSAKLHDTVNNATPESPILNLNSTSNDGRLWKSYFSFCTEQNGPSTSANSQTDSKTVNLNSQSNNELKFTFDTPLNHPQLATFSFDSSLKHNHSIKESASNTTEIPLNLPSSNILLQNTSASGVNPYTFTHCPPADLNFDQKRVFNCIDTTKLSNVPLNSSRNINDNFNTLNNTEPNSNVISNLTDDSSDDDANTDRSHSPPFSNNYSHINFLRATTSSFENINNFDNLLLNRDETDTVVNEMTDNRSLNFRTVLFPKPNSYDISSTIHDCNEDSNPNITHNTDTSNSDSAKSIKPLQVRHFNCSAQNRVENGLDDNHVKYIFGKATINCGIKIVLHLKNLKNSPKLYIGLTTCNPDNLTDFEMPYQPADLCERTESWTLKDFNLSQLIDVKTIILQFENDGRANIKCHNLNLHQLYIDYAVSTWPFFVIQNGHVDLEFLTDDIQNGDQRPAVEVSNKSDCVICYENPVDTVIYKCGHSCLCLKCGQLMLRNLGICPICRDMIHDVIKIYTS